MRSIVGRRSGSGRFSNRRWNSWRGVPIEVPNDGEVRIGEECAHEVDLGWGRAHLREHLDVEVGGLAILEGLLPLLPGRDHGHRINAVDPLEARPRAIGIGVVVEAQSKGLRDEGDDRGALTHRRMLREVDRGGSLPSADGFGAKPRGPGGIGA
jgi:hypothetical protein